MGILILFPHTSTATSSVYKLTDWVKARVRWLPAAAAIVLADVRQINDSWLAATDDPAVCTSHAYTHDNICLVNYLKVHNAEYNMKVQDEK